MLPLFWELIFPATATTQLPNLSPYLTTFHERAGYFLGFGRDSSLWDKNQAKLVDDYVDSGYRRAITPPPLPGERHSHPWSFLQPLLSLTVWPTLTIGQSKLATISNGYITSARSRFVSQDGTFYPSMVGQTVVFEAPATSFVIDEYVSANEVYLSGSIEDEDYLAIGGLFGAVFASGNTTITAAGATFLSTHINHYLYFTTSGNSYKILSFTSPTVVVVAGNATGELVGSLVMTVLKTVTITANGDYLLPFDFGGLLSPFVFQASASARPISLVAEHQIRDERRQNGGQTGDPLYVSIVARSSVHEDRQRYWAMFTPIPDAVTVLSCRYRVLPQKLTSLNPYPVGTQEFSEVVRTAILAVIEQEEFHEVGVQAAAFLAALAAAVSMDRQSFTPDTLGSLRKQPSRWLDRYRMDDLTFARAPANYSVTYGGE